MVKILPKHKHISAHFVLTMLCLLIACIFVISEPALAQQPPEPFVAIHISELTQALETMPAIPPTPTGEGTTGFQWSYTTWRYFVAYESLKETLRSDGTPFVIVSDSDIDSGKLLNIDGSPRYPILISLVAEATSDSETSPLREYVNAGGFLLVGASSFTRNPDGSYRSDFTLADEMGVHMANSGHQNIYANIHFTKAGDHRLTTHIPDGNLIWRQPLSAEEISTGVSPDHVLNGSHNAWQVVASDATVIATGDAGPLLAVKSYGRGQIIYHGLLQPLIGHGGFEPGMYAYLIYRKAIEWAFESFTLPLVKVSPWPYPYDAAMMVRHDFENDQTNIRAIESSAQFENALGVKGDYFFSTGALRDDMSDNAAVISSLRSAVANFGATIGSHNGGLKNPGNLTLAQTSWDYWHWGPDEILDLTPSGYASGKAYATASILASFQDIEGWLSGLDNGKAGCGAAGNCPRTWVSPNFNSTREGSRELLEEIGRVVSMGEQKISPFPHRTLSYKTPGKYFATISLPVSDWYIGSDVAQSLEFHTIDSIRQGIDFYYKMGALINFYGHAPTNDGSVQQEYVTYGVTKPRLLLTNSVDITDWWQARTKVAVAPAVTTSGDSYQMTAAITGVTNPETAIEVALPAKYQGSINVFLNGQLAAPADYQMTDSGVKIRVNPTITTVRLQNVPNSLPVASNDAYSTSSNTALNQIAPGVLSNDTHTEGASLSAELVAGPAHGTLILNTNGSFIYTPATDYTGSDSFTYRASDGTDTSNVASVYLTVQNQPPTAANDIYSTYGNTALNQIYHGVLENDTDPEGANLTAELVSGAAHGSITLNTNGSFIYTPATDYTGSDSFTYRTSDGNLTSGLATVTINVSPTFFLDDFTRAVGTTSPLWPWVKVLGNWTVTNGELQASSAPSSYAFAYTTTSPEWTDYSVEGQVQFPAGAFGGGLGGRVNAANGARYGVWVYPAGSLGGSNVMKLVKFRDWTTWSGTPMQQVSLPNVGTGWHTLKMAFIGNSIQVFYDGTLLIDVTDNYFDATAPYTSGGISGEMWTYTTSYTMKIDNVSVTMPIYNLPPVAVNDSYSTNTNTAMDQKAPGVLGNDSDPEGASITAQLVSAPAHGTLTLNSNGSFVYIPATDYAGSDSFTYRISDGNLTSGIATVDITVAATMYSDDFTRDPGTTDLLSPWINVLGSWTVADGVLQGSSSILTYASVYTTTPPVWNDYAIEGQIQFPDGAFGGGLGGRVNAATGARYGAWIYPAGSLGGSNVMKLVKFRDWTSWSGTPMQQVSLPDVGTGWHTLKLVFIGSGIQVFYDGSLLMNVTDNNFDARAPYTNGGISGEMWTYANSYTMEMDNMIASALP